MVFTRPKRVLCNLPKVGNDDFNYSSMKWLAFRSHIKRELQEHEAAEAKATQKARKKWRNGIMGKSKKSGEAEGSKKNKKKRQRAGEDDDDTDERPQKAAKKKGRVTVDSDNLDESDNDSDTDSD
jgi:hypothetical protein